MKKVQLFAVMLMCVMGITSCSNNKSSQEETGVDSAAVAQAQADSIARADSIAKVDSIAKADSVAKASTLAVGMKVTEALQKPGVKRDLIMDTDASGREVDTVILIQDGKKYLTNVVFRWYDTYVCENLKFEKLPDSYDLDVTKVKDSDFAPSAKIVKQIK